MAYEDTVTAIEGQIAKDKKNVLKAKISPDRDFGLTVSQFEPDER